MADEKQRMTAKEVADQFYAAVTSKDPSGEPQRQYFTELEKQYPPGTLTDQKLAKLLSDKFPEMKSVIITDAAGPPSTATGGGGILSQIQRGTALGSEVLDRYGANVLGLAATGAEALHIPGSKTLRRGEQFYRETGKQRGEYAASLPKPSGFGEHLAGAVPEAALSMVPYLAARTPAGMAVTGAIEAADRGPVEMMKSGAAAGLLGKAMPGAERVGGKVLSKIGIPARVGGRVSGPVILGAGAGLNAYRNTRDPEAALAQGLTWGGLAAASGRRPKSKTVEIAKTPAPPETTSPTPAPKSTPPPNVETMPGEQLEEVFRSAMAHAERFERSANAVKQAEAALKQFTANKESMELQPTAPSEKELAGVEKQIQRQTEHVEKLKERLADAQQQYSDWRGALQTIRTRAQSEKFAWYPTPPPPSEAHKGFGELGERVANRETAGMQGEPGTTTPQPPGPGKVSKGREIPEAPPGAFKFGKTAMGQVMFSTDRIEGLNSGTPLRYMGKNRDGITTFELMDQTGTKPTGKSIQFGPEVTDQQLAAAFALPPMGGRGRPMAQPAAGAAPPPEAPVRQQPTTQKQITARLVTTPPPPEPTTPPPEPKAGPKAPQPPPAKTPKPTKKTSATQAQPAPAPAAKEPPAEKSVAPATKTKPVVAPGEHLQALEREYRDVLTQHDQVFEKYSNAKRGSREKKILGPELQALSEQMADIADQIDRAREAKGEKVETLPELMRGPKTPGVAPTKLELAVRYRVAKPNENLPGLMGMEIVYQGKENGKHNFKVIDPETGKSETNYVEGKVSEKELLQGLEVAEPKAPPGGGKKKVGTPPGNPVAEAKGRLKGRIAGLKSEKGEQQFLFDTESFKDAYTVGRDMVQKFGDNFQRWSQNMIYELGEAIKPRLQEIWDAIKPAPVWYSQLERTIADRMPNQATVEQVRNIINNPQSGVKPDEIKWTGLDDYLASKKGKVSKEDISSYLKNNALRVNETVKGGEVSLMERQRLYALEQKSRVGLTTSQEETEYYNLLEAARSTAQYNKFQLPGGTQYRELLFWLPPRTGEKMDTGAMADALLGHGVMPRGEATFQSGHWDQPNVLAHTRFNDRIDAEGKKVLFMEELQSDWHQQGREKGYSGTPETQEHINNLRAESDKLATEIDQWETKISMLPFLEENALKRNELKLKIMDLRDRREAIMDSMMALIHEGIPDAPFSKSWHEMVMRRMLRWAAEKGYDKLAWTTGEQQAERYNLAKHIKSLHYEVLRDGSYELQYTTHDDRTDRLGIFKKDKLPEVVGKELANKIVTEAEQTSDVRGGFGMTGNLHGLDLKIGGSGMKGFYDKILPEYANKYGKKWGARVEGTEIETAKNNTYNIEQNSEGRYIAKLNGTPIMTDDGRFVRQFQTESEARDFMKWEYGELDFKPKKEKVHSIQITPEMRDSVMKKGQPIAMGPEPPESRVSA